MQVPVTVFFGYRNVVGHLIRYDRETRTDNFTPEIDQWCKDRLQGPARPIYVYFYKPDEHGTLKTYACYHFEFACESDAILFKLAHIGNAK